MARIFILLLIVSLTLGPAAPRILAAEATKLDVSAATLRPTVRTAYLAAVAAWKNPAPTWETVSNLVGSLQAVNADDLRGPDAGLSKPNVFAHTRAIETALLVATSVAHRYTDPAGRSRFGGNDPATPTALATIATALQEHVNVLIKADPQTFGPAYETLRRACGDATTAGIVTGKSSEVVGAAAEALCRKVDEIRKSANVDAGEAARRLFKNPELVKEVLKNTKIGDQTVADALQKSLNVSAEQFADVVLHGAEALGGALTLANDWDQLSTQKKVVGIMQTLSQAVLAGQAAMAVTTMGVKAGLLLTFLMACDFFDLGIDMGFPWGGGGDDGNDKDASGKSGNAGNDGDQGRGSAPAGDVPPEKQGGSASVSMDKQKSLGEIETAADDGKGADGQDLTPAEAGAMKKVIRAVAARTNVAEPSLPVGVGGKLNDSGVNKGPGQPSTTRPADSSGTGAPVKGK